MDFENTITERDMDASTQQFAQGFRTDSGHRDADLDIDGLSESLLARVVGLFSSNKI